jgi:hypothetical protein
MGFNKIDIVAFLTFTLALSNTSMYIDNVYMYIIIEKGKPTYSPVIAYLDRSGDTQLK